MGIVWVTFPLLPLSKTIEVMKDMNFISLTKEELENIIIASVEKAVRVGLSGIQIEKSDKYFTVHQAAEFLGLSVSTIYRKSEERVIPSIKKGKRLYFCAQELEAWLRSGKQMTVEEIEEEVINSALGRKGARYA